MVTRLVLGLICFALSACSGGGASLSGKDKKKEKTETAADVAPPTPEDEKENDDLRVIPPEVVSGAYLACERGDKADGLADDHVRLGCTAYSGFGTDKKRLDLSGYKKTWTVTNKDFEAVDAAQVKDVEVKTGSKYDKIWDVRRGLADLGLKAKVDLVGHAHSTVTLKSTGLVFIDGVLQP